MCGHVAREHVDETEEPLVLARRSALKIHKITLEMARGVICICGPNDRLGLHSRVDLVVRANVVPPRQLASGHDARTPGYGSD